MTHMVTYVITKCKGDNVNISITVPADNFESHDVQAEIAIYFYYNKSKITKFIYIEFNNKDATKSKGIQNLNNIYKRLKYKHASEYVVIPEFENNLINNIINMMYECFRKQNNLTMFPCNNYIPIELISQTLKAYINSNA